MWAEVKCTEFWYQQKVIILCKYNLIVILYANTSQTRFQKKNSVEPQNWNRVQGLTFTNVNKLWFLQLLHNGMVVLTHPITDG